VNGRGGDVFATLRMEEELMVRGVRSEWKGRCFCHPKNGRRIDGQRSEMRMEGGGNVLKV